ncbi:GbsR/MarR family transcriptional regulator [Nocardia australiensis]|uniref:GbsR/MarR family transcriptional regulator n=1 Tax=Nocardia australiensis TaxID=2887191 RepID=UPI0035563E72
MPGSRLTHADRTRIAEGLAGGLGYAEIARELNRPTSTISREVGRNGGPHRYRADEAQHATRDRSGRIRGEPDTRPAPDSVRAFTDGFAATMVSTGLPRMPAMVLACLLTSESGELPAAELIRGLGVSPASVSKAVAYLEDMQLIRRERRTPDRRERYIIDQDVWYRALAREVLVCATWASAARDGAELLGDTPAGTRLDQVHQYFEHVGADLARSAEHWRQVFIAD